MSIIPSLTLTVTPWITEPNEWLPLIMIGIFFAVMWLLVLIIWLCVKYCCKEHNYSDYSSSTDITQLTIENNRYTPTNLYRYAY